jgi:hypothetical protein
VPFVQENPMPLMLSSSVVLCGLGDDRLCLFLCFVFLTWGEEKGVSGILSIGQVGFR